MLPISIKNKILSDISNMSYNEQEEIIIKYINSLLYGDISFYLEDNKIKIFNGISKEYSKKYMHLFNKTLRLNFNSTEELKNASKIKYNDDDAYEYVCFFVFIHDMFHPFGSFKSAYKYANEMYLIFNMVLGNAAMTLAENSHVFFGRIVAQNGKIVEKDVEYVVNKDFYKKLLTD